MRRTYGRRPARRVQTLPSQDRWLLSYADFVTLLLAVFIVLFASSWQNGPSIRRVSTAIHSGFDSLSAAPAQRPNLPVTDPKMNPTQSTPAASAVPSQLDTTELSRQLQTVLGDAISKQQIVLQTTPDGLIVSLRELGFFESGKATLLPGAADKLRRTADVLKQHGLEVRVEGHSDDQPIHTQSFQSNWELSTARATNVLSLLLQTGFPAVKLSVAGYGPYHPVADNATSSGRAMNRRVDLVVVAPRTAAPLATTAR